MEFVWISLVAIIGVLAVASILHEKFREKNLFDKFYIHDPKFEGKIYEISEVLCIEGFFRFVFSQASEKDCLLYEGFPSVVPSDHLKNFEESIFRGDLALVLSEDNKEKYINLLSEILEESSTESKGPMVNGSRSKKQGKLPNRQSKIWNIVDNVHITNESGWLLVSYDWLTCCWLSGRISEIDMEEASAKGVLVYSSNVAGGTT